ncbi:discoidin domain-containing protein [Streptomyces sp. NRRL S-813]|uniref:discoidin domain-containing protein n=1 Tax=Streptomyces sp. NRRL S-813 TaxID=1463919 RepID=UPI00068A9308|nr:discoidin domain-containing protein [Streptomyces sp. NRRL S-813]
MHEVAIHPPRKRRRQTAWLIPALAAVLVAATVGLADLHRFGPEHARASSSAGALVVSADLQDAVRPADAADTHDLDTFVRRLTASTPRPPDVLLLTEVLGPGAHRIADRLTAATGKGYQVLLAPGRSAFLADGAVRESAIVVNTTTMRVADKGRFVRVQGEDQASAAVTQKATALRLPLISAHAAGDPLPAAQQLHTVVAGLAGTAGPQDAVTVLGGDYRAGRCVDPSAYQPVDCAAQAFWTTLTSAYGYDDAFFARSAAPTLKNTAYVFARGNVTDAYVDTAYDEALPSADRAACKQAFDAGRSASAPPKCRSTYYADAPFGWAVVRAGQPVRRSVAPASVTLDRCELGVRKGAALARVVNGTGQDITDDVTVDAPAPLQVTPGSGSLTVPADQARTLPLKVTAPQQSAVGTYDVRVTIGQLTTELPVSVPSQCTEPPVVATSYHSGFPPVNAVDGDINTFWHSEYSPPTPLPQSITLNLEDSRQVSKLTYQPRFDGNLNGTITGYNVYVSTDGQAFTKVAGGTWAADARLKTATFTPVTARYVRLEAISASGGSYCSAAEITAG